MTPGSRLACMLQRPTRQQTAATTFSPGALLLAPAQAADIH